MRRRSHCTPPTLLYLISLMVVSIGGGSLGGCTRGPDTSSGDWRAAIDSTGPVTTVRTLGGSVWGEGVRLIEDASIGLSEGEEPYLLGEVSGIAMADGRILILDLSVPVLRMYDRNGRHFRDIGGRGSGPGEFQMPWSLAVDPATGLIFVRDEMQARINVYLADGSFLEQIRLNHGIMTTTPLLISHSGLLYTPILIRTGTGVRDAYAGYYRDGTVGDTLTAPELDLTVPELEYLDDEGEPFTTTVPFSPEAHWTLTPDPAVVCGTADTYRFEIRRRDGRTTVIERAVDPVPLDPTEREWYRRRLTARIHRTDPGWSWRGEPIPGVKPFFDDLVPDHEDRIWVLRRGAGIHLATGNEDAQDYTEFLERPCWRDRYFFDVFETSGRFLGSVLLPDGFRPFPRPDVAGDTVLLLVHDNDGVPRVKRFRLDLPDGR